MGKIPYLKRSNGSEMVTKILTPCLGKLLDFVNLMIFPRWLLLKHFKIVRQRWEVFEWGILHIVARIIHENAV